MCHACFVCSMLIAVACLFQVERNWKKEMGTELAQRIVIPLVIVAAAAANRTGKPRSAPRIPNITPNTHTLIPSISPNKSPNAPR